MEFIQVLLLEYCQYGLSPGIGLKDMAILVPHFPIPAVGEELQWNEVLHVAYLVIGLFLQPHALFNTQVISFSQLLSLLFQLIEQFILRSIVNVDYDVLREVDDALQAARREVKQQSDAAGNSFREPTMGHGRCQLDMAHALSPDLGQRHFDTAPVATYALVAYLLVFTAVALEVLSGTKYPLAEKPISLGFQAAVIYGLRFCDLTP